MINTVDLKGTLNDKGSLTGEVYFPEIVHEKDYEKLNNKPSINSKVLIGDRTFEALGLDRYLDSTITAVSNVEIDDMF